jgi:RNA chaperone Hfq
MQSTVLAGFFYRFHGTVRESGASFVLGRAMKNQETSAISRQDRFLQQLQEGLVPVVIYLKSGVKLLGTIVQCGVNTMVLRGSTTVSQLVYKHSILTIVPLLS